MSWSRVTARELVLLLCFGKGFSAVTPSDRCRCACSSLEARSVTHRTPQLTHVSIQNCCRNPQPGETCFRTQPIKLLRTCQVMMSKYRWRSASVPLQQGQIIKEKTVWTLSVKKQVLHTETFSLSRSGWFLQSTNINVLFLFPGTATVKDECQKKKWYNMFNVIWPNKGTTQPMVQWTIESNVLHYTLIVL